MEAPIKIYLESTVLIDFSWEEEYRHEDAEKLIAICERYPTDIEVYTSEWSWAETHGRVYSKMLERDLGITWEKEIRNHKRANKEPRTHFPPFYDKLSEVTRLLEQKEEELKKRCRFQTVIPSELRDIFYLTRELARLTAIFPKDSIHVAIAIEKLVHFFVATDGDLLDKIIWHQVRPEHNYIQQLRNEMADPFEPPPFEANPLIKIWKTQRIITKGILTRLNELGFS